MKKKTNILPAWIAGLTLTGLLIPQSWLLHSDDGAGSGNSPYSFLTTPKPGRLFSNKIFPSFFRLGNTGIGVFGLTSMLLTLSGEIPGSRNRRFADLFPGHNSHEQVSSPSQPVLNIGKINHTKNSGPWANGDCFINNLFISGCGAFAYG
jgi:hypothetical protein